MAIEKHTTEAILVSTYHSGENDLNLKLFTKDFGMIFALAKSARKLESKLKTHIKKSRYCSATLVKGKDIYRLVGIVESQDDVNVSSGVIIVESLDRFMRAEGKHAQLYNKLYLLSLLNIDTRLLRITSYIITLIDLGYADANILGYEDIDDYKSASIDEICLICSNNQPKIRAYIRDVINNTML